jgi:hypothetical protein
MRSCALVLLPLLAASCATMPGGPVEPRLLSSVDAALDEAHDRGAPILLLLTRDM